MFIVSAGSLYKAASRNRPGQKIIGRSSPWAVSEARSTSIEKGVIGIMTKDYLILRDIPTAESASTPQCAQCTSTNTAITVLTGETN
jgi:hypothetical protein